jgi:iron(III) transport system ATP-binding protein
MLAVTELRKQFRLAGNRVFNALDSVSLEVKEGQFFTLLGPSGCGKTTMLRCIAGLETPDAGRILINGQAVVDAARRQFVPPNRRKIGMVFQSYAIWPHMNVFENVAFPLRVSPQKISEDEIRRKVRDALATIRMSDYESRQATRLSGGQQQRLAMARALVMNPRLLLLDEPLSNLDALLREAMRLELARLQKEHGITTNYVTHDQSEALALSDQIALMNHGRIVQTGTPQEIYRNPATAFVADFIGTTNLLRGDLVETGPGRSVVTWNGQPLFSDAQCDAPMGEKVAISVRPSDIRICNSPKVEDPTNAVRGRVVQQSFLGTMIDYVVDVQGVEVRAWGSPHEIFKVGEDVNLRFRSDCMPVFKDDRQASAQVH